MRSALLVDGVKGLAMYGVMKRPEEAGTDSVSTGSCLSWMAAVCFKRASSFNEFLLFLLHCR